MKYKQIRAVVIVSVW